MNTILIIDNNETDSMITEKMLTAYIKVDIIIMQSWVLAVDKMTAGSAKPDLIYIEADLPPNSLRDFLETLKTKGFRIPTYLLSCLFFEPDIRNTKALNYPFQVGFITKPITKNVIVKLASEFDFSLN